MFEPVHTFDWHIVYRKLPASEPKLAEANSFCPLGVNGQRASQLSIDFRMAGIEWLAEFNGSRAHIQAKTH